MKKVIIISLNDNAFQVDEPAYHALHRYLEKAESRLKVNPDRAEIIRDLEQSIADKFGKLLSPQKNVVNFNEVDLVLKEIGMVDPGETEERVPYVYCEPVRKRLYRIKEGQKVAGVCTGLAAYSDLNVSLVRWLFALLTIFTGGTFALVYIVMMFVVPVAHTSEERAAAYGGMPVNIP